MKPTTEGVMSLVDGFLVLFSAMWDARVPAAIAITALASLGIYKLSAERR